jgi:hypothetical protein
MGICLLSNTRSNIDEQINAVVQIKHIILDVLHLALVTKPWMICDFNIPNEWLLGRDHNENELEVRMILLALFSRSLTYVINSEATYSVIILMPHLQMRHARLQLLCCWLKRTLDH